MKKLLSLFLALALVISTVATFSAEEEKAFDGYIYMTVERNTLGQGFVQEPLRLVTMRVTLWQILQKEC